MASVYIHIPFCRQACSYCDFHFSTLLKNKQAFITALMKEMEVRKDYLSEKNISTVYFGGGTPSLLSENEILYIFEAMGRHYSIRPDAEITLEANPEDLDETYLSMLKQTPVNRLSIGIQSFFGDDLEWMNRAHTADKAIHSVKKAQDAGFENISIDLIYGIPALSNEKWESNLARAVSLNVQHISAYSLTVEKQTALHFRVKSGRDPQPDSEKSAAQFEILMRNMKKTGFMQYEISNFAKPGFISRHNSSYWLKEKYLGLGPSAHSYNGNSRQWNIANNPLYVNALLNGKLFFEKEILTMENRYNEYVLTSLRTRWGASPEFILKNFGDVYEQYFSSEIKKYIRDGSVLRENEVLVLSDKGKLFADKIASDLFMISQLTLSQLSAKILQPYTNSGF